MYLLILVTCITTHVEHLFSMTLDTKVTDVHVVHSYPTKGDCYIEMHNPKNMPSTTKEGDIDIHALTCLEVPK